MEKSFRRESDYLLSYTIAEQKPGVRAGSLSS